MHFAFDYGTIQGPNNSKGPAIDLGVDVVMNIEIIPWVHSIACHK